MTILSSDIRLLESERMTDTTDGGGRRTTRVIPDGVAGNIFPKVSRVDSVYGRVNLRKIYPHINTANLDVYAGAHFVITDAPDNNRIGVLAFSTGSDFDTRTAARDRIESYVIAGPMSRMTLYGRQLQGTQAILAYQRVEEPLPEIGDVYAISTEVGGTTTAQQFVRVQDVAHEVRTFEESTGGTFERRVLILKIGAPLRFEFNGLAVPSRFSSDSAAATGKLRTTTVADAARYYGIQPLSAAVSSGALELSVASVYAPIVPTTQRETPLSLASVAGAGFGIDTAAEAVTESHSTSFGAFTLRTLRPIKPGTLVIDGAAGRQSRDDGNGIIVRSGGATPNFTGTVDYESGVLQISSNGLTAVEVVLSYMPQVYVSQTAHTHAIDITLATRGTVYSVPLLPLPAPGTLMVDFRALGKWYRLRDNGAGELVGGDAQYGTGTVDYVTGGATITLGALPDVGSSVLLSWGSPVHYEILAATPSSAFEIALAPGPIKPSTVVLTWMEGATAKTASDNGSGAITGDATGTIVYQTGALSLTMAAPIAGTVSIAFDRDTPPVSQSSHEFGGAVNTHSVRVSGFGITLPNGDSYTNIYLGDNGAGQLRWGSADLGYFVVGSYWIATGQIFGSVNYTTGVVTLAASVEVNSHGTWNTTTQTWDAPSAGSATINPAGANYWAILSSTTPDVVAQTQTATIGSTGSGLQLVLGAPTPTTIVPGSVLFTAFGKQHIDRNGTIYTDLIPATGSASAVGTINYATGEIYLTDYPTGTAANFVIRSALGRKGDYTATSVAFRTAGSPLRPASLYVQCTAADGELLTATSDQNGIITGASISGEVEQTMGVAALQFAKPVMPGTLRYSAVVLSNLPLNAEILGLDPVRLPSDGRVPIYRPADVTVIHHTDVYNAGTPAAGSTINVGRTDLSALWLEDADKKKLAANMYAVDLAAGTATMAADMDLTGYVPPIAAKHRIEEMNLLSDVQINGLLTLTAPLLRSFPAGSLLSSALLYGDLQARATNLFDQQTWTNVWQGTVIGSSATATYNDVDYPVEVLNNGAVTERWRLNFTTTTSFQVIGENLGVIATGTTGTDLQPINNLTGLPYFTLRAAGWGSGWAVGNQLRFNTIAAAPPTWLARCVLPGAALTGDSFDAQLRGDVD